MRTINKKSWIISQTRRLIRKWPPANRAVGKTKKTFYIKSKHGKDLKRCTYTCELCGTADLKSTQMNLDHITPVVPVTGWDSFDGFLERLFCDESGFQYICISCHDDKTAIEDMQRAPTVAKAEKVIKSIKKKLKRKKRS